MAEPTNDEAARALDRMASGNAPTPQPKPRAAAPPKPNPATAKTTAPKTVRPSAPVAAAPSARQRVAPPVQGLEEALAAARHRSQGLRTPVRGRSKSVSTGLGLKRTLIPILLTTGVILNALAITHFAWRSDDNPMIEMPIWIVATMFSLGLLAWLLAAANMISVRRTLASPRQAPP